MLVDVLYERGVFAEREEVLAPYVDDPDESVRALTAMARAIGRYWGLADGDGAEQVLAEAEARVTEPAWWWEIPLRVPRSPASRADPRRPCAARRLPRPAARAAAEAQAALAWAFALGDVGRVDEAIEVIDRALGSRGERDRHLTLYEVGLLVAARGMALVAAGRLDEAQGIVELGHAATVQEGSTAGQGFFAAVLDWIALHRGDTATAAEWAREALRALRISGHRGPARWAAGGLLFAAALARDHEAIEEATHALDGLGEHPAGLLENGIERARAWAAVADGRLADARARLERAAVDAAARGAVVDELATLTDLAELGDARTERALELGGVCEGALAAVRVRHVVALGADDAAALEGVAQRYEELGMHRAAASATMAGSDAAARAGDLRGSRRMAQLGIATSSDVPEGAVADLAAPTPLTRREREIAGLAATGASSRDIAEQLYLSVRTVDNHLSRVYVKLGVRGRHELAELAGRLGLLPA